MTESAALHIVFGPSAAGSLRQALRIAGRDETVLCPFDDFSFGPIPAGYAEVRARWVEEALGYSEWQEVVDEAARSLEAARSSDRRSIAWVSFSEARSYAGFLWWLSQTESSPSWIMNVPQLSSSPTAELIGLLDCEEAFGADERARRQDQWRRLQSEDVPLRIIVGDDLVSAPLTHFDASLISVATTEWQPKARIVGGVLGTFYEDGIAQTSDLVLASRLGDLAEAGILEWRGDLSQMRGCELRLPSSDTNL